MTAIKILDENDRQSVAREHSACAIEGTQALVVRFRAHTPHWRTYPRNGYARAKFEWQGKPEDAALSLHTMEGYEGDKGRFIEKETMLTFDNHIARELYAFLRERFEPEADNNVVNAVSRELDAFANRIGDALGTGERGENLIAVARDAHNAELRVAHAVRVAEDYADINGNGQDNGAMAVLAVLRGS